MLDNIPQELKALRQFVTWRYETRINDKGEESTTKVPYCPHTGRKSSVTDFSTWGDFDSAMIAIESGNYAGIGFVLTENDPYTFIDLDDAENDNEILNVQKEIYYSFDSYTEQSPSGAGAHIIVKGKIPEGRRRSKVETYYSERYMTMTGVVVNDKPIEERQDLLDILWAQLGASRNVEFIDNDINGEQTKEDSEILAQACNAKNGQKVIDLLSGDWPKHYNSQSEADFALINNIAFYTQNREQVLRIFRNSALGKRDKAERDDYVIPMINRSFDRKLPIVNVDYLRDKIQNLIEAKRTSLAVLPTGGGDAPAQSERQAPPTKPVNSSEIPMPPGLVGEIASYIYHAAVRPIPEAAIAGALGLMAGICGRAYNTHTGAGLNLYILLLALTGTGKEGMANGIEKLMRDVGKELQGADKFIGPEQVASEQAMTKYLASDKNSSSFVSVVGEYAFQLQQMTAWNAQPHQLSLQRMMLNLYNKSGEGSVVRPSIYSNAEKTTGVFYSPAVTLLGESVPNKFYEILDENMISTGLLPRFNIIEYRGGRPPLNEKRVTMPSRQLIDKMVTVCGNAMQLGNNNKVIQAKPNADAKYMLDQFNLFCDDKINESGNDEVRRQLWNRSHVKALKIASLLAVGCNPYEPVITDEMSKWAINLCIEDAEKIIERFDNGAVGEKSHETEQRKDCVRVIGEFLERGPEFAKKYGADVDLAEMKLIPNVYILRRLRPLTSFKKDKRGPSIAIKNMLQEMQENGEIENLAPSNPARANRRGNIWSVLKPNVFLNGA